MASEHKPRIVDYKAPLTDDPDKRAMRKRALLIALKLVLIIVGLVAWFSTQAMLGARPFHGGIGDGLLEALAPAHDFLETHPAARNALLITSSAVIDLLGIYLLGQSIFGRTLRPFIGLVLLFGLRQVMQCVCVLPAPEGMICPVGIAIALFEMVAVLMLRAHWTMDVYAGAVTAVMVAMIAGKIAEPIDRWLARLTA
jgi:hypothetical protein